MKNPHGKHKQGLWVIFTSMNVFTVSTYQSSFSGYHVFQLTDRSEESKTQELKSSLVKPWERNKEMTFADPQRRKIILAYRL